MDHGTSAVTLPSHHAKLTCTALPYCKEYLAAMSKVTIATSQPYLYNSGDHEETYTKGCTTHTSHKNTNQPTKRARNCSMYPPVQSHMAVRCLQMTGSRPWRQGLSCCLRPAPHRSPAPPPPASQSAQALP
mmetsp:Transcript_26041/g.56836  ORF Transcript_26041/g.56836 Transcript_26041/m.56836 type:complete len:131 (+) Transcript_26041:830-1222(+)